MRELSYKLRSLSATASAVTTPECPDLEAGLGDREKEDKARRGGDDKNNKNLIIICRYIYILTLTFRIKYRDN